MKTYLKIENPGICPTEGFTLLGASTKRDSQTAIGRFGSGNKHGVNVCLRHHLSPVVFCGSLKLEFGTRVQRVNNSEFNRVFVKYGGKDSYGTNRSSTEDLGYVLEYGATDWLAVDLALREFISNAIDKACEEDYCDFWTKWSSENNVILTDAQKGGIHHDTWVNALKEHLKTATPWENVKIEIVQENQVRAKTGTTRVFIPINQGVLDFVENLGKWFLHFSEPELLSQQILPKNNRNLSGKKSAVIYRRGVRVREFESSDEESLFDYNLETLQLDESRQVNDWQVQHHAAHVLCQAGKKKIGTLIQSFIDGKHYWEHSFQSYPFTDNANKPNVVEAWKSAFIDLAGENAVATLADTGEMVERKGYKRVFVPSAYNDIFKIFGIKTPDAVLSEDDIAGRQILTATSAAVQAVDWAWDLIEKLKLTNGEEKPKVKSFIKSMSAGCQTLGYYKLENKTVYLNMELVGGETGMSQQLLATALEECVHHCTKATDGSRDIQDFLFNMVVLLSKSQENK